jgi:dethiobiotin synthetase
MLPGLFIAGTDTGIGKTYVTCRLAATWQAQGQTPGIYKPVCSGAAAGADGTPVWEDIERLNQALCRQFSRSWICPQRFQAPLAPPVAARQQGTTVDSRLLRTGIQIWQDHVDLMLVESAGGWLSPIAEGETCADLAVDLDLPVLLVAGNRLGMISHTLLTLESIRHRGLQTVGIVINQLAEKSDMSALSNQAELQKLTSVPILGILDWAPADELRSWPGFERIRLTAAGSSGESETSAEMI